MTAYIIICILLDYIILPHLSVIGDVSLKMPSSTLCFLGPAVITQIEIAKCLYGISYLIQLLMKI